LESGKLRGEMGMDRSHKVRPRSDTREYRIWSACCLDTQSDEDFDAPSDFRSTLAWI
jgi:hypothetical protein